MAEGGDAIVTTIERLAGAASRSYAARLRAADLAVYMAAVPTGPDMQGMLGSLSMPCRLYVGEEDPVFPQTKLVSQLRSLTWW
jgi:hypothetical protein